MIIRLIEENEKILYNKAVTHIVQSWEWGEFRKSTGLDLIRIGHFDDNKLKSAYQLTFHPVPLFNQSIGYLPKGPQPDKEMIKALGDFGKKKNVAYIKIEPNVIIDPKKELEISAAFKNIGLTPAKKSLFTKYNFLVDLNLSESELLSKMHPKTRYNIGVAQKKGVQVYESTQDADFEIYLKLYFETTKRQGYFGHTPEYHKKVWQILKGAKMARVLIAKYQNKPLVAWMLFNFGNTLYYPYGGSSNENRDVMASNLICWQAILLGKKMKLGCFDMWGALGPEAKDDDPWFGFHRFKAGYGPMHVQYVGTYDLILKPALYNSLNIADRFRWMALRFKKR